MSKRAVLVAGAQGVIGRAAAEHFSADFLFGSTFDNITSTIKARRAGFHACMDTEEFFTGFFAEMREGRVLPPV